MSDKEYSFLGQTVIPSVVVVTPVDGNNATFGERQCAANLDITDLAFGDDGEFRQVAFMIQTDMEFDDALG